MEKKTAVQPCNLILRIIFILVRGSRVGKSCIIAWQKKSVKEKKRGPFEPLLLHM